MIDVHEITVALEEAQDLQISAAGTQVLDGRV